MLLTIFCLTLDHVLIDDNHGDSGLRLCGDLTEQLQSGNIRNSYKLKLKVYLAPGTGVVGFIKVIEITLMISLLQTESLTSDLGETLCLVVQRLPAHREVGEGETEGEWSFGISSENGLDSLFSDHCGSI